MAAEARVDEQLLAVVGFVELDEKDSLDIREYADMHCTGCDMGSTYGAQIVNIGDSERSEFGGKLMGYDLVSQLVNVVFSVTRNGPP